MSKEQLPEAWLRGPIEGIDQLLMPAAHALIQSGEDIENAVSSLSSEELWVNPGGAASVGFHLRHIAGSIDRLITYAQGEGLNDHQRTFLLGEGMPGDPPADAAVLVEGVRKAIDQALEALRSTPTSALQDRRGVGRAKLPTTVLGLLFHIAEHTQRHTGQVITTAKIVRGLGLGKS